MLSDRDLTRQETHFAFGQNWASYAAEIDESQITQAQLGLARLLGDGVRGKRFVDIGCGSGVHALAAMRLGAKQVVAIDIDPDSVETTRALLQQHANSAAWSVHQGSILDLGSEPFGRFDIVYSWGVLHHTGDMCRAIRSATQLVAPGGQFAFALYRKSLFCDLWKIEKQWYAAADRTTQRTAERLYVHAFRFGLRVTGRSLDDYIANYKGMRGMDFYHDVRDWLGGWPYESISAAGVQRLMNSLGFVQERVFGKPGIAVGLFGVGCNEYVYTQRRDSTT